jgi:cytidyltransferase-like protein
MKKTIVTSGCFDDLCSKHVRFLYEISRQGNVVVLLFGDDLARSTQQGTLKFPLPERQYYLESIRYVDQVHVVSNLKQLENITQLTGRKADKWIDFSSEAIPENPKLAQLQNIPYQQILEGSLPGFPDEEMACDTPVSSTAKKVIVTGSFDWFHSGHVRFLEEASEYGDLYAIVGHDQNILELKGPGHPMFKQDQRRFMVGAIRYVKQSIISTGHGWMDAEPEIHRLKPDIYIVNEDGDKDVKRKFCEKNGIEYRVLKREPLPGLQRRTSTALRGF